MKFLKCFLEISFKSTHFHPLLLALNSRPTTYPIFSHTIYSWPSSNSSCCAPTNWHTITRQTLPLRKSYNIIITENQHPISSAHMYMPSAKSSNAKWSSTCCASNSNATYTKTNSWKYDMYLRLYVCLCQLLSSSLRQTQTQRETVGGMRIVYSCRTILNNIIRWCLCTEGVARAICGVHKSITFRTRGHA